MLSLRGNSGSSVFLLPLLFPWNEKYVCDDLWDLEVVVVVVVVMVVVVIIVVVIVVVVDLLCLS